MALLFMLMMGGVGVAFVVALLVAFMTGRISHFFGVLLLMLLVVAGAFFFFFGGIGGLNS